MVRTQAAGGIEKAGKAAARSSGDSWQGILGPERDRRGYEARGHVLEPIAVDGGDSLGVADERLRTG